LSLPIKSKRFESFDESAKLLGENIDVVGTWVETGYEDEFILILRAEELV
jgi:hypothetical protein